MNDRQRFFEKRDFVIKWLLKTQFTTAKIICESQQLNRANQARFLRSLKQTGLFLTVRSPLILEEVWILSNEGLKFSMLHFQQAENVGIKPSRVITSTTIHSLCIQQAIMKRTDPQKPLLFKFDKFITNISKGKRPDALYVKNNKVNSIEIELTQKSNNRIYLGFFDHIENMREGHYSSVEYIFPTDNLMNVYKKRFDADQWPLYQRNRFGKIEPKTNYGVQENMDMKDSKIKKLFKLTVEELY